MQFKRMTYSALAAAALYGVASFSASAAIINFDQSNASSPTGTVSYDGEGGALIGEGISFDEISFNDGPAPQEETLSCAGCVLSFNTGGNISEGPGVWTFGDGGDLSITGDAIDSNGDTIASGDLVQGGTFTGDQLVAQTGENSLSAATSGADGKNIDLLEYFGLAGNTDFTFSNTDISLGGASFADNGGFTADVTAADFQNTSGEAPAVPEPSELGLFALGVALLVGGFGFRRQFGSHMG